MYWSSTKQSLSLNITCSHPDRNGLHFKKITFKSNAIYFNKHDIEVFINDTWRKHAGDIGRLFKITRRLEVRF